MLKSLRTRLVPKHNNNGDFVRRPRYELSVLNTASQSHLLRFKGSKWGILAAAIAWFIAIGGLWLILCIYTPISRLLPVRMQAQLRNEYIDLNQRLDQATQTARINQQYIDNVLAIIQDSIKIADPVTLDNKDTAPLPIDSLLQASGKERSFVNRFENAERFNVSVLSPLAAEGMTFYPPVMGLHATDRVSDSGIPYIQAAPAKSSPISAIYRGTVLNTYFTTGKGITVVIQHPNDFVSEYSGLAECFVTRGEKILPGTRIGIAQDTRYPFIFELWHNGSPLPARDYILF